MYKKGLKVVKNYNLKQRLDLKLTALVEKEFVP